MLCSVSRMLRLQHPRFVLVLFTLPLGVCTACSSTNATSTPDAQTEDVAKGPEGGPPDEGAPDGEADAPADAASVWRSDSTGFDLVETGGILLRNDIITWHYDAASRGATMIDSVDAGSSTVTSSATLTPGGAAALSALLAMVTPVGRSSGCGQDLPDVVLTVRGPGGASQSYSSDCGANVDSGAGPFVSLDKLQSLTGFLTTVTGGCDDGGLVSDASASCGRPDATAD
jgi:hypothetical protein